jgi:hypothetical protein
MSLISPHLDEETVPNREPAVATYADAFLKEYTRIVESEYKPLLDRARKSKRQPFKLYGCTQVVCRAFFYDYGTWILFCALAQSRIVDRLGDAKYTRDWGELRTNEEKEAAILSELELTKDDVIDSVIVEGVTFLVRSNVREIRRSAVAHARMRARVHRDALTNGHRGLSLQGLTSVSWWREHRPHVLVALALFLFGMLVGSCGRLGPIQKVNLFGVEVQFGERK